MKRKINIISMVTLGLTLALGFQAPVFAKTTRKAAAAKAPVKKEGRISSDPDAPTYEEAKVLGWGPVKAPVEVDQPEYLVRGVVMDMTAVPNAKDSYNIKILPIETLENRQRFVTRDNFQNGLDLVLTIPKSKFKELHKGQVVEFHQFYESKVAQSIGGAQFVNYVFHQDLQGYPVTPVAYATKTDFYPIQYLNALKGIEMFDGKVEANDDLRAALDAHASNTSNPDLQNEAKSLLTRYFNAQPSGKCKADTTAQKFVCK